MSIRHLALCALLLTPNAFAQNAPPIALPGDATLLQVNAHGESHRVPDVATISAGVVTRNADANAALRANAARMSAVVAALKQAGVAERDIQTSSIGLQPQYTYGDKQPPKITGYEVANTVSVRLRETAKIGNVLDTLVRVGANQILGPNFSVDKPEAALDEARRAAVEQARTRADVYAQAAGLKVRRIVSITESSESTPPRPMARMTFAATNVGIATPVETGENTLAVDLDVRFELGR
ncbi:MAG: SIMPL domain-containing protein [Proteobacteria bacterium]|nr:SIMPL domain-containing protein [Pseudomonadota bacterium]